MHDGRVVRTRATDVWLWYRSLTGSLLVERRGVGRSHSVWWWPTAASEVCLKERPCGPVVGRSVWWWRNWGLTQMSWSGRHVARVGGVRERRGNAGGWVLTLLGYLVAEAKKRRRVVCARLRTPTRGTSRTTSPPPARVLPLAPPSPLGESGGPAELEFMSLPAAALSSSSCSFLSAYP